MNHEASERERLDLELIKIRMEAFFAERPPCCIGDDCARPVAYKVAGWDWYLCTEHYRAAIQLRTISGPAKPPVVYERSGCKEVYLT